MECFFGLPWCTQRRLGLSQPLGLWCFVPPIDPVRVDPPLAFLGYGGLFLCVVVSFFHSWQDSSIQDVFFGGVAELTCCRRSVFWPVFSPSFSDFGSQIYTSPPTSTWHAPPTAFSIVFRFCRRKHRSCGRRCSERGHHAPKSFLRFGACEGHSPPFSSHAQWQTGSTASNLRLGGTGDSMWPTRATFRGLWPPSLTVGGLFWVFLLVCVCVILLFFRSQPACVWI
jgi:hypothetical protein